MTKFICKLKTKCRDNKQYQVKSIVFCTADYGCNQKEEFDRKWEKRKK